MPAPDRAALAAFLDAHAPLDPAPLVPEIQVFRARDLTEIWSAADRLAGGEAPPPFWAYPWPAGAALARVVLDRGSDIAGRRVLDIGTGGGIAALAAAKAGAAEVVANDRDPWAVATALLAAERQRISLTPLLADLTLEPTAVAGFDVVLCGDLHYERSVAPRLRELLVRAACGGALVLVADAGRAYFDATGMTLLAEYRLSVPRDLEGVEERTARVYRLERQGRVER